MTYYEVDESVLELEQQLDGDGSLTAPLLAALHDLQEVRRDTGLPVGQWVAAVSETTRRAIDRIEAHARASAAPGSILQRLPGAAREELALHQDLFSSFRRQLALARAEPPGRGLAIRLLDSLINRECELALHINGLGRLLQSESAPRLAPVAVRGGELI